MARLIVFGGFLLFCFLLPIRTTASPYIVRIYATSASYAGDWSLAYGGFNGKNTACSFDRPATCIAGQQWALVTAPGSGYCLNYAGGGSYSPGFSASSAVYSGVSGYSTVQLASSWTSFWNPSGTPNWAAAGLDHTIFWTGATSTSCEFPSSYNLQCISGASWSTSSSSVYGVPGFLLTSTPFFPWWSTTQSQCSGTINLLCACLETITSSPTVPTSSPTVPTASPTVPTSSPTIPTKSPTKVPSRSPSRTPSSQIGGSIILYGTTSPPTVPRYTGWLPRASSTTACINEAEYSTLGCGSAFAIQGFVAEGINYALPVNYATGVPFPSTAPIRGPNGLEIAANWGKLWDGTALERTLAAAGVVAGGAGYWTGINSTGGVVTPNCLDWTSADVGPYGTIGNSGSTSGTWIDFNSAQFCADNYRVVCACVPKTLVPPTPAPQGRVVLYSSNVFSRGLGSRATTDAACSAQGLYDYLQCGSAYALLGYGGDASTNYALPENPTSLAPFSSSIHVTGPTGIALAANWSQLWNANVNPLLSTTFNAGVFVDYQNGYYTGILGTGLLSTNNCLNWTSILGSQSGDDGYSDDTSAGWIHFAPPISCINRYPYMCVCVPPAPTGSPTTATPTKFPTAKPSRAPSFSHPSLSPTPPTSAPTAPTISYRSKCGFGRCQTQNSTACVRGDEPQCACAPSQQGTLCLECSFLGYLDNLGDCVCASMFGDPEDVTAPCSLIAQQVFPLGVERRTATSECSCFDSHTRGAFRSSASPVKMGVPNPPVCDLCKSDGLGYPPGTVIDIESEKMPATCTRYGGVNPSLVLNLTGIEYETEFFRWTECSGHGRWTSQYRCECDAPNWKLVDTGQAGIGNETVVTCSECSALWGPPGQCTAPYVPDPTTGKFSVCGGHGVFTSQGCACFENSTAGWWELATVSEPTTVLNYTDPIGARTVKTTVVASVQACVACQPGYGRAQDGCFQGR